MIKTFAYDTEESKDLKYMGEPFCIVQWSRHTKIPQEVQHCGLKKLATLDVMPEGRS